ncbi:NAD(P)-binding protein [Aspergillus insuetus]
MSDIILITGASGFLASHILLAFLEAGYRVRGTVRSPETAVHVAARYPQFAEKLSFAVVPDIAAPHAFDEAVKGVAGVIHTASPFVLNVRDNARDLLQPALQGTLNILKAAAEQNSAVQRVVVTASFASMLDLNQGLRPGYRYTEADWNPCTYEMAEVTTNVAMAYCASKSLAERGLWDWVAESKPSFSVATICPPWIFGPTIDDGSGKLNESTEVIWNLINGSRREAMPENDFAAFAHVRDVAEAHLKGYVEEKAANQRFIVAGGQFLYQDACDIIRTRFPELKDKVPEGKPGSRVESYVADGSKAAEILGLKYHDLESTLVDTVADLLKKQSTWPSFQK